MRLLLSLWAVLTTLPATADDVWTLRTGPEAVASIPLDPVQPVSSWRGLYGDGEESLWLYATRSPYFFLQPVPSVRRVPGSPWTVAAFFPKAWTPAQQTAWLDRWIATFRSLQTLPDPGWPVVFPSVLHKG